MAMKLCYINFVDASTTTISSNSEVASLPDDNVAHFWKTKVWRATGDAAEWIKFDLGAAKNIKAVIIVGHNLTSGATITIEAHASDAWGAPTLSQVLTHDADIILFTWSTNQSYRWWRLTIADGSNPDTYVEIGRIYIGSFVSPERGFQSFDKINVDPSAVIESDDGAESINEKIPYFEFNFNFQNVLLDNIELVRKYCDRHLPLFIIPDYDNALETDGKHDLSRYVRFSSLPVYSNRHLKRYDTTLSFKELR